MSEKSLINIDNYHLVYFNLKTICVKTEGVMLMMKSNIDFFQQSRGCIS